MIELTVAGSNRPALVDDCYVHLSRYRWKLDKDGYVARKSHGRWIYLHHIVLPGSRYPAFLRDHVNRDKLDNRTSNLRWLTQAESNQNRSPARRNRTGFRGVMPEGKRYRATARLNGVVHRFGLFDTPEEANAVVAAWRAEHMPYAA